MQLFTISNTGAITANGSIAIHPILPKNAGYASNYVPNTSVFNPASIKPPVPSGFNRTAGDQLTFPAGLALSPDKKFLTDLSGGVERHSHTPSR
jgi:hypothetical protein